MANKRMIPRARKRLRVELNGVNAFTSDVSPGGFCVELLDVLPPGSDVSGSISLEQATYAFSGKVQWTVSGERKIMKRGRMGVRFTGIDPAFFRSYLATVGAGR